MNTVKLAIYFTVAVIIILATILILSFMQKPSSPPKGPQIQKVIIQRDIKLKEGSGSAKETLR